MRSRTTTFREELLEHDKGTVFRCGYSAAIGLFASLGPGYAQSASANVRVTNDVVAPT